MLSLEGIIREGQVPAYSLPSGKGIYPALSPGGRELRHHVNRARLYDRGQIDYYRALQKTLSFLCHQRLSTVLYS